MSYGNGRAPNRQAMGSNLNGRIPREVNKIIEERTAKSSKTLTIHDNTWLAARSSFRWKLGGVLSFFIAFAALIIGILAYVSTQIPCYSFEQLIVV